MTSLSNTALHFTDEKRYGCARFPMELYPETSTRPAPDGSNSVDSQASHHTVEVSTGSCKWQLLVNGILTTIEE